MSVPKSIKNIFKSSCKWPISILKNASTVPSTGFSVETLKINTLLFLWLTIRLQKIVHLNHKFMLLQKLVLNYESLVLLF